MTNRDALANMDSVELGTWMADLVSNNLIKDIDEWYCRDICGHAVCDDCAVTDADMLTRWLEDERA